MGNIFAKFIDAQDRLPIDSGWLCPDFFSGNATRIDVDGCW
jgi:hypothetical protein